MGALFINTFDDTHFEKTHQWDIIILGCHAKL